MVTGQRFGRAILLLSVCALAACGGGGGGNLAASIPSAVPSAVMPAAGIQANTVFSTILPSRPGIGANTSAPVIASGANTGLPPLGSAFPVTQSAVLISNNTVAPDAATNSGGATIDSMDAPR